MLRHAEGQHAIKTSPWDQYLWTGGEGSRMGRGTRWLPSSPQSLRLRRGSSGVQCPLWGILHWAQTVGLHTSSSLGEGPLAGQDGGRGGSLQLRLGLMRLTTQPATRATRLFLKEDLGSASLRPPLYCC